MHSCIYALHCMGSSCWLPCEWKSALSEHQLYITHVPSYAGLLDAHSFIFTEQDTVSWWREASPGPRGRLQNWKSILRSFWAMGQWHSRPPPESSLKSTSWSHKAVLRWGPPKPQCFQACTDGHCTRVGSVSSTHSTSAFRGTEAETLVTCDKN